METRVLALAALIGLGLSAASCFLVQRDDDPISGSTSAGLGGTSGSAGAGGSSGMDGGLQCPTGQGTEMVAVGPFCIDRTETTVDQANEYNEFRSVTPDYDSDLPGMCAAEAELFGPQEYATGAHPAINANWCTAQAYCHWRGKRLCGNVGGGPVSGAALLTSTSEWYQACSGPNETRWPYGASYVENQCNIEPGSKTVPVGSFTGCEGGFPGLFDMSGNVSEWIDACSGATCTLMGDQWDEYVPPGNLPLGCKKVSTESAGIAQDNFGVRCCWSP